MDPARVTIALLLLMIVDIFVTVVFTRRAEAAAHDASETSHLIIQGLLDQADREPLARRRHL